jgi:alkaline phosphatase
LSDGRFLLAEEYGPSLLVVSTNGQVLVRYTPRNKPLSGAISRVNPILPSVLAQRRTNRGFEALALSSDGRAAWAILQSPAGDGDSPRFKHSRIVRAIRLDLTDPLKATVTGHFLLALSTAADYGPDQKQTGIKLNDAEWLAPDRMLVLETGDSARLVIVNFREATNLLGRPDENSLEFEAAGVDLDRLTVKPATTEVWADLRTVPGLSRKLEGLAVLNANEILLANDNDFGLGDNTTGEPSRLWRLRLPRPLPIP